MTEEYTPPLIVSAEENMGNSHVYIPPIAPGTWEVVREWDTAERAHETGLTIGLPHDPFPGAMEKPLTQADEEPPLDYSALEYAPRHAARIAALEAEVESWREYFGCDSVSDAMVLLNRKDEQLRLLGKEQGRANVAEKKVAALETEMAKLREAIHGITRLLPHAQHAKAFGGYFPGVEFAFGGEEYAKDFLLSVLALRGVTA